MDDIALRYFETIKTVNHWFNSFHVPFAILKLIFDYIIEFKCSNNFCNIKINVLDLKNIVNQDYKYDYKSNNYWCLKCMNYVVMLNCGEFYLDLPNKTKDIKNCVICSNNLCYVDCLCLKRTSKYNKCECYFCGYCSQDLVICKDCKLLVCEQCCVPFDNWRDVTQCNDCFQFNYVSLKSNC